MGMAASQARYLALVARKSNCEYEGQQINQARLVLSNQTANLFNQMLGLQVPVPPSTQDYTKTQYSFSTGSSTATIDRWDQLANPEPDYNYVVSYHFYNDVYTGSQKRLVDPQVQFSSPTSPQEIERLNKLIQDITSYKNILTQLENEKKTLNADITKLELQKSTIETQKSKIENYTAATTLYSGITDARYNDAGNFVFKSDGSDDDKIYTAYANMGEQNKKLAEDSLKAMQDAGLIDKNINVEDVFIDSSTTPPTIAFKSDLDNLIGTSPATTLSTYGVDNSDSPVGNSIQGIIAEYDAQLEPIEQSIETKKARLEEIPAEEADAEAQLKELEDLYEKDIGHPTYVGNCGLTLLESLDPNQEAELLQVWKDMKEINPESNIFRYFDDEGGGYKGGIYTFRLNGVDYYTTLADLEASYQSGTGINNIDGQDKLYYYNASMVKTKFEKKEKALLETDSSGRFTSVRFEDDSVAYTLTVEQITDEDAYKDAMNQFNYETNLYNKMVQDINAKTSIIQQEDRTLELRLKQLDTEQNALSQEMDAVQKVVKDNVEKSFKTFGG